MRDNIEIREKVCFLSFGFGFSFHLVITFQSVTHLSLVYQPAIIMNSTQFRQVRPTELLLWLFAQFYKPKELVGSTSFIYP